MGIYSNVKVYVVCWTIYNAEGVFVARYQEIFEEKMTLEQIQSVKENYDLLTEEELKDISIQFYTCCSSSLDNQLGTFMAWFPGNKESLDELFTTGDTRL